MYNYIMYLFRLPCGWKLLALSGGPKSTLYCPSVEGYASASSSPLLPLLEHCWICHSSVGSQLCLPPSALHSKPCPWKLYKLIMACCIGIVPQIVSSPCFCIRQYFVLSGHSSQMSSGKDVQVWSTSLPNDVPICPVVYKGGSRVKGGGYIYRNACTNV